MVWYEAGTCFQAPQLQNSPSEETQLPFLPLIVKFRGTHIDESICMIHEYDLNFYLYFQISYIFSHGFRFFLECICSIRYV